LKIIIKCKFHLNQKRLLSKWKKEKTIMMNFKSIFQTLKIKILIKIKNLKKLKKHWKSLESAETNEIFITLFIFITTIINKTNY
jgi:hypothetical protein